MVATTVSVRTYAHAVTHVTENILRSFKDIIRQIGLSPGDLAEDYVTYERAIRTWIESEHLERVVLEIFEPKTSALVSRWDVTVSYEWSDGDGAFWVDTDAIRYAIQKAGQVPSACSYRIVIKNKPGRPDVSGWSSTTFRSTSGFVEQRIGTTVNASGLGGGISYYRKL
jgi:hypothetical protein